MTTVEGTNPFPLRTFELRRFFVADMNKADYALLFSGVTTPLLAFRRAVCGG